MHTEAPVRVLKITGLGRSGSTVLDVVLGNHPDIESVGEVWSLIRTGWISRESLRAISRNRLTRPFCTCGKRLDVLYVDSPEEACPFWSEVRREWVARAGGEDEIEGYPELQDAFELKRRWPRLLLERRRPTARFRTYARMTREFYESIRAVSGKPVIVDSATIPTRTFVLGMVPGIDLYAVHLVRDGRGVVSSRRKFRENPRRGFFRGHKGQPMWMVIVLWIMLNLLSEWVCGQLGPRRSIRLRYEDFVADPRGSLARVGSLLDLDLSGLAAAASSGEPMRAGHNVGGNRTKKSGTITLRPDRQEWRTDLSPREKRLAWALMGWLMRRYSYDRQG